MYDKIHYKKIKKKKKEESSNEQIVENRKSHWCLIFTQKLPKL